MFTQHKVTRFIVTSIIVAALLLGLTFLGQEFGIEWLRKAGMLLFFAAFAFAFIGFVVMIPLVIGSLLKK